MQTQQKEACYLKAKLKNCNMNYERVSSDLDCSGKNNIEILYHIQESVARCHKVLLYLYQDLQMFLTNNET